MTVEVRPVRGAPDRRRFASFPRQIYRGDPHWPEPLLIERKGFIDPRKHPFFRHGRAEHFLAWRDAEVVGRITASEDPRYNELHDARVACFGLFECREDPDTAVRLIEGAATWARARGLDTLRGPIDYSTNYPLGTLVEGFQSTPSLLLNYNPPYYPELLEGAGLAKAKDLYTFRYDASRQEVPERWKRLAQRVRERGRVNIRPVRLRDYPRELERIERIYSGAWEKNWGAVPMTRAEFQHMGREIKPIVWEGLVLLAEVDDEPVGFSLSLPDLNPVLKSLRGRLLPFGWFRLLRAVRTGRGIPGIRTLVLGVLEGYRRRGVTESLILATIEAGVRHGVPNCEMGWTLEDNELINRAIEHLGGKRVRTYRIYERAL